MGAGRRHLVADAVRVSTMGWVNLEKLGAKDSPYVLRMMPRDQIERGIAMRRYAWRKPTQQIADEAGVARDTIVRVLAKQVVTDASYATLTSYLKTAAGAHALINNRQIRSAKESRRRPLLSRVMRLTGMAIDYGLKCYSRVTCDAMTEGELKAYYYRLEFRLKERILIDPRWPDDIRGKYVIPDHLEAWEWVERLDQLMDRQTISANSPSVRSGQLAASLPGKPNPYIVPSGRYPSL